MITVNLFGGFAHLHKEDGLYSMTDNRVPKNWKWVRNRMIHDGITIFVDDWMCQSSLVTSVESKFKVGMIMEPPQINNNVYSRLDSIIDNFDLIITYNEDLVSKYPNKIKFYPFGGSWVHEEYIGIYEKSNLVNILLSSKQNTEGHKLRHEILNKFPNLDSFGSGVGKPFEYKEEVLAPYMFSIVVENSKLDDYFTEKILDCFALGTIPVYWGTNNMDRYFDTAGIIYFNTIEELNHILPTLTPELYESKSQSIRQNHSLFKTYYCQEDWIYENIFKNLLF
jgi:hypothetical protein